MTVQKRALNQSDRRRHTGRMRRKRILYCRLLLFFLLLLVLGSGAAFVVRGGKKQEPQSALKAEEMEVIHVPEDTVTESRADGLYEEYRDLLILVNKENPLDFTYTPKLRWICEGRLQIQETVYEDLVELLKAGEEAGYNYWIASAYRSREYQEELMEAEIEKNREAGLELEEARKKSEETLMEPGYSEHETGLAIDILVSGNPVMDIHQDEEPGNQWLREHAFRYGFILRYPEEKTDLTGIRYEPWHFRYVGREMAGYLQQQDLCLEEFYQLLQKQV